MTERRKGHSALRVRDGKLGRFDPNPSDADAAAKAWLKLVSKLPVLSPNAEEGFRAGWHAALSALSETAKQDSSARAVAEKCAEICCGIKEAATTDSGRWNAGKCEDRILGYSATLPAEKQQGDTAKVPEGWKLTAASCHEALALVRLALEGCDPKDWNPRARKLLYGNSRSGSGK